MSIVTVTVNPCIDKSCVVERVLADRKLAASRVRRDPGGGGLNVARVVSRLGGDVCALWTSGGRVGAALADLLDAEGLSHAEVPIADEVRENLIVGEEESGQQYRFGMPGPALTEDEQARWADELRERAEGARYVVFSGSLPGSASLEWFGRLLAAVPEGVRVVVDTKRGPLQRALEHGVYLVKPNVEELEDIADRELDDEGAILGVAREVIERGGCEVVLVSLGRGGALLVTAEHAERFTSPSVKLRSKIGAGDSMVGGLVQALDAGATLSDATVRGVAAGTAAVMTEGTELCHAKDVHHLLGRVERRGLER